MKMNLRRHILNDPTMGNITQDQLDLLSDYLAAPWFTRCFKFSKYRVSLALIGATFARSRGVPEPIYQAEPIATQPVIAVPTDRSNLPSHEDFLKAKQHDT
jgi:hypothetical protein